MAVVDIGGFVEKSRVCAIKKESTLAWKSVLESSDNESDESLSQMGNPFKSEPKLKRSPAPSQENIYEKYNRALDEIIARSQETPLEKATAAEPKLQANDAMKQYWENRNQAARNKALGLGVATGGVASIFGLRKSPYFQPKNKRQAVDKLKQLHEMQPNTEKVTHEVKKSPSLTEMFRRLTGSGGSGRGSDSEQEKENKSQEDCVTTTTTDNSEIQAKKLIILQRLNLRSAENRKKWSCVAQSSDSSDQDGSQLEATAHLVVASNQVKNGESIMHLLANKTLEATASQMDSTLETPRILQRTGTYKLKNLSLPQQHKVTSVINNTQLIKTKSVPENLGLSDWDESTQLFKCLSNGYIP
ncbi:hypothetical protein Ciccas_008412 [Cichlidogyrus casuarinus]|uniref:Uncharacterized protein n=1 Tax=Cichlidogyrus casuarinus TaxID=1844966 RepID=A0ABD2Q014_9PLAT